MKKKLTVLMILLSAIFVLAGNVMAQESQTSVMETEITDYSYMFESGTSQISDIDLNEVDHIAVLFTSSPLPQSLFLDMENSRSYYDPSLDIYYNIQVSKYIRDLSSDERTEVENIWRNADFLNWDFYYEGTQQMDYECHLAIETDNAVYHYEIKGVDAPAPDSLMDFITDILHTFWDPEIIS